MSDLRFAFRQLMKAPAFTAIAIGSLAIGIGATTTVFSLVNAFLLRALPVKNAEELVLLRTTEGNGGRLSRGNEGNGFFDPKSGRSSSTSFSLDMLRRFREERGTLSEVFAFAPLAQPNVLIDGQPESGVTAQFASGTYHTGLGVNAAIGRLFRLDDDQTSAPTVAVISHRYWTRRFARDPSILGRTILLNKVPVTIVGVTAAGFEGTMQAGESADLSVPLAHHLAFQPTRVDRIQPWYWWIRIMGRLAPGISREQAAATLEPIYQTAAQEGWLAGRSRDLTPAQMPTNPTLTADPGAQGENDARRDHARSLTLLLGLASLLLLAACANVGNLLLARGAARRREIAVRLALGASRGRVVRQLMVESLTIAALAAVFGAAFAYIGRDLLLALRPFGSASFVLEMPLDIRVLGFSTFVSVAAAICFGLAPALRATRLDLRTEFGGGSRALGGQRSRFSQALMVIQMALSLILLVSAGLFSRTLQNLESIDAGFNRHDLIFFRIDAQAAGYARSDFTALHTRLLERLGQIPGVQQATYSRIALLSRERQSNHLTIPGGPNPDRTVVDMNGLAPNFFGAMGLPLVLGRGFTEQDNAAAPRVAIINQTLAARYFGHENPIGRQMVLTIDANAGTPLEIIGVAGDAKYRDLRDAVTPTLYLPALQQIGGVASFSLRLAPGTTPAAMAAIREAVREIDTTLPVGNLRTQEEQVDRLTAQERLFTRLSVFFGGFSLLLACIGLYGLMSYTVMRRTGEIGLRMSLGALPRQIVGMVLRESLGLLLFGIGLGTIAAWWAGQLVASMLYGLAPADPLTYSAVILILTLVALLASVLPARRAARISPMVALRSE